jgi:hypothetical protein
LPVSEMKSRLPSLVRSSAPASNGAVGAVAGGVRNEVGKPGAVLVELLETAGVDDEEVVTEAVVLHLDPVAAVSAGAAAGVEAARDRVDVLGDEVDPAQHRVVDEPLIWFSITVGCQCLIFCEWVLPAAERLLPAAYRTRAQS